MKALSVAAIVACATVAGCGTTSGRSAPIAAQDVTLQVNAIRHGGGLRSPSYDIELVANGEKVATARTRETATLSGGYRGKKIAANCGTHANWKGQGTAANVVGIASGTGTYAAVVCDAFIDGAPAGQLVAIPEAFK